MASSHKQSTSQKLENSEIMLANQIESTKIYLYTLQFLIHILTMPILYGLKILMLSNRLLYYKKSHQNNIFSALKLSFKSFFFQKNNILKFSDNTVIDNILFITKTMNNMLPLIFKNWFQFCYNIHH